MPHERQVWLIDDINASKPSLRNKRDKCWCTPWST